MYYQVTFTADGYPEQISETKALALMDALNAANKPEYIQIGDRLVKTSTIRAIEPQRTEGMFDKQAEEFQKDQRQLQDKHTRLREARLALKPYERAREPEILKLAWWASTGLTTPPPDKVLVHIFLASEYYFTENPTHSLANPKCYKYAIEDYIDIRDNRNQAMSASCMALIERIILEDK